MIEGELLCKDKDLRQKPTVDNISSAVDTSA